MDPVMQEVLNYMLAFGGLVAILFFGMNFLTKGFIWQYIRVKAGRGKKILLRIHSPTDIYYRPGTNKEGSLEWTDRSGMKKAFPFGDSELGIFSTHEMGINVVNIDEFGNKLLKKDFKIVKFVNIDPGRIESLILRIKNRPVADSTIEKVKFFIMIATFLGILYIAFTMTKNQELITSTLANFSLTIS